MTDTPKLLLAHHLKTLKLPTVLREFDKVAQQCAAEGLDHVQFLARLVELELIDRERRMIERRIKAAKFPAVKSLDSFDFKAIPSLNKMQVLNWPAANGSSGGKTSSPLGRAARAKPMSRWARGWPPVRRASLSASSPPPPWSMN